ncbi:MAG: choice-of-anchor D domain-containing protein [Acidobacteria bacterium]|nr:choice-of-anchor D domain-containing protein [Acidobacteriota bacterium]
MNPSESEGAEQSELSGEQAGESAGSAGGAAGGEQEAAGSASTQPTEAEFSEAGESAEKAPSTPSTAECPAKKPKIGVNWRDYDFGRIKKGGALPVYDLVISSTGEVDLASIAVNIEGDQFKVDNPGGFETTLAPGKSTTVKIKFEPTGYGEKTAKIRVTSNAVNENPVPLKVKGKQYSVITFVIEDEKSGEKIDNVKLKVKQAGQAEQDVTTAGGGKAEVETEHDGNFEVKMGEFEPLLEFRDLTTA